jgi:hypothetical protein
MMPRTLLFVVLVPSTAAVAVPANQQEIPNGTVFRCLTCHTRSGGGEGWNDFGKALLEAGGANPDANPGDQNEGYEGTPSDHWLTVCGDDSDGDGVQNGVELGDGGCVWARGEANPTGPISNPGDAASIPEDPGAAEGEGEGEAVGGCTSSARAPTSLLLCLGLLALLGGARVSRSLARP